MRIRTGLALATAIVSFAVPVRAGADRAFSSLDFGDSRDLVARKIRENLDDGRFQRECYKCPARVTIGGYGFKVGAEFYRDRLWRVSLRHIQQGKAMMQAYKQGAPPQDPRFKDGEG